MAIVGRDLDVSERKDFLTFNTQFGGQSLVTNGGNVTQTGSTLAMFMIPFPCTVRGGLVFNQGVSGAPGITLTVQRFVGGATVLPLGLSMMVLTAYGTSGVQGLSGLAPQGSTLNILVPGDVVYCTTTVANSAIDDLMIQLIVQKTQDIVAYQGSST